MNKLCDSAMNLYHAVESRRATEVKFGYRGSKEGWYATIGAYCGVGEDHDTALFNLRAVLKEKLQQQMNLAKDRATMCEEALK